MDVIYGRSLRLLLVDRGRDVRYDESRLPPVPLHVPGPLPLRAERLVARAAAEQGRLRLGLLLPVFSSQ